MGQSRQDNHLEGAAPIAVVLPGDDLTSRILSPDAKNRPPKLGTGLYYDASARTVTAMVAGRLYHRPETSTYMVLNNTRRYVPRVGDRVLGIVEETAGEYYRLNIHGPHPALLHNLSFEGATKRNRPYLAPGALLYCRVISSDREMDPEVSCKVAGDGIADGGARRRDWMTDEGTYGELKGGTCTRVSLGLARELLLPGNVVLDALGKQGLSFEVAIGVNGIVWVHSEKPEYTVLIGNAIKNSEVMTPAQVRGMVAKLVKAQRSEMLGA
eukprot:CAMPEP_0183306934 /NCGR_PEP_ID=MMETSP0160_2-20130417/15305_1 /TAXON_ID=2839 ORGANISM="Odontella Sinensis, Strain Grunow 1884" /NCGR_SAMPLE_ID=MMETSP0160_2 /ASSEMBLY_ACC=CAM_ASM_000250 /LENGTH=268 /DNA_ID=CAMNT_0025470415 /DNA_START=6 /DNA_END=812 /DNA_ORIENTATION=-